MNPKGRPKTHGKSHSSEYRAWIAIRIRCFSQNCSQYPIYGGRGITICSGWKENFVSFYEDLGDKPSKEYSIDRIDSNGNYSCGKCEECKRRNWPMNCRWATRELQNSNRRPSKQVEYHGISQTLREWARMFGKNHETVRVRVVKRGMSVWDAINT